MNAGSLGHITITGIAGTGVAGDKNEVSTLTLGNVVAKFLHRQRLDQWI